MPGLAERRNSKELWRGAVKAQRYRSQDKNREDALERLRELIIRAAAPPKIRKPTRPTKASQKRRLESKERRSGIKASRRKIEAQ